MKSSPLADAIYQQEAICRKALDRMRELGTEQSTEETYELTRTLRLAVDLTGCLRRLVPGLTVQEIHAAFGAPGDFGYETPLGETLARIYLGKVQP
jgi:hypothetical protein